MFSLAMSTLAVWSRVARSRDVRSRDISAPTVCLTMFDVGFVESRTCTLNNLSLVPVTFSLRVPNGNPESSIHSQTSSPEAAMSTAVKEFQVTPLNGVLEAQSQLEVHVVLCSRTLRKYRTELHVDVDGVQQSLLVLPITARCIVVLYQHTHAKQHR